jgi:hypothetical protein
MSGVVLKTKSNCELRERDDVYEEKIASERGNNTYVD